MYVCLCVRVLHRHWQELGYLIIYVTGRPDMQRRKVLSWLSQHNFPHGLVSFADGLTTEPLRHKADYLRQLVEVSLSAAGGGESVCLQLVEVSLSVCSWWR